MVLLDILVGHLNIQVWFGERPKFIEQHEYLKFLFQIRVSDQNGSGIPVHRGAEVGDPGVWRCKQHHPGEEELLEGLQDGPQEGSTRL